MTPTSAGRRARRAAFLGLALAVLWLFGAMLLTAKRLNEEPGDRQVAVRVAPGLPLLEAERHGRTTTLAPGFGAAVVLLALPVLLGSAGLLAGRRRRATLARQR